MLLTITTALRPGGQSRPITTTTLARHQCASWDTARAARP
jgi:hypothetical protein